MATPLVGAWLGYLLLSRQTRSHELLGVRIDYYRLIAPDLNRLMCFMTFIGDWKETSPVDAVHLKRRVDRNFFTAAPLFSKEVHDRYGEFMDQCFHVFGPWGQDARLRTSARKRRTHLQWDQEWNGMFEYPDDQEIPGEELAEIQKAYDKLLRAMVRDLDLTRARPSYTTDLVALNAHAPQRTATGGEPPARG